MRPYLLDVDLKELQKFEKDLLRFKSKALPFAVRETINEIAFEAQRTWKQILPTKMKLRNKYTQQSIRVEKAKNLNIQTMQSRVGSIADYMDEQEFGGVEAKKKKHGVPIPAAAPGRRKNRGKVAKAKQFKAINILPSVQGSRSRKIVVAMAMAKKRGGPSFAFLKVKPGRKGIFSLDPGSKRSGIRKIWDLSKSSVVTPANPTMSLAVKDAIKRGPGIYREALIKQLRFHKAFGY